MDSLVIYIMMESILALLVVLVNILVCVTVYLHKELRSITNYLIACLAMADLGVGALGIPFSVVLSLGKTLCFYSCLFMACFPLVTAQFSMLLLLVIAINMHLKIRHSARYAAIVNKRKVIALVFLCWVVSVIAGFTPLMGWNQMKTYTERNITTTSIKQPLERSIIGKNLPYGGFLSKVYYNNRRNMSYSEIHRGHLGQCSFEATVSPEYLVYFHFLVCTLLPLLIMLGLYVDLFRIVQSYYAAQGMPTAKRSEVQTARSLFLMLGLFCLLWVPLNVNNMLWLFCSTCSQPLWVSQLTVFLSHLNSLTNPLLYAMRKKNFGAALRLVFVRYILCIPRCKRCCPDTKVYPKV
ncbi:adenosine receptor A1-like [Erpetoichthys calabaricus]|uniref:adenosine receptor A1-like n=1 Tax=Erpetoichthys calabaricus TaxID=27687 RepID=UPI0010A00759|nr:adenosine receptor A1-like [Erpetoichthys calabaricus]